MKFNLEDTADNKLLFLANDQRIVDIRSPGHSIVDLNRRKSSLERALISPSKTLEGTRMKRYLIPFNSRYLYSLHYSWGEFHKTHALYAADPNISDQLGITALQSGKEFLLTSERSRLILDKLISFIISSFKFDIVVTDTPELFVNMDHIDISRLKITTKVPCLQFLNRGGVDRVPITSLSGECLNGFDLPAEHELRRKCEGKSVLCVVWCNKYLPSFIQRNSMAAEFLPVSIFHHTNKNYLETSK